MQSC